MLSTIALGFLLILVFAGFAYLIYDEQYRAYLARTYTDQPYGEIKQREFEIHSRRYSIVQAILGLVLYYTQFVIFISCPLYMYWALSTGIGDRIFVFVGLLVSLSVCVAAVFYLRHGYSENETLTTSDTYDFKAILKRIYWYTPTFLLLYLLLLIIRH